MTPRRIALLIALTSSLVRCGSDDQSAPETSTVWRESEDWLRVNQNGQGVIDFAFLGDSVLMLDGTASLLTAPALGGPQQGFELENTNGSWLAIESTEDGVFLVSSQGELCRYRDGETAATKLDFALPGVWLRSLEGGWLLTEHQEDNAFAIQELRAFQPATNQVAVVWRTTGDNSSDDAALGKILASLAKGATPDRDGVLWFADETGLAFLDPSGPTGLPEAVPVLLSHDVAGQTFAVAAHPEGGMVVPLAHDGGPDGALLYVLPSGVTTTLLARGPSRPSRTRIHDGYVYTATSTGSYVGLYRTRERVLPPGTSSEPSP